jgi:hypothetical protein
MIEKDAVTEGKLGGRSRQYLEREFGGIALLRPAVGIYWTQQAT